MRREETILRNTLAVVDKNISSLRPPALWASAEIQIEARASRLHSFLGDSLEPFEEAVRDVAHAVLSLSQGLSSIDASKIEDMKEIKRWLEQDAETAFEEMIRSNERAAAIATGYGRYTPEPLSNMATEDSSPSFRPKRSTLGSLLTVIDDCDSLLKKVDRQGRIFIACAPGTIDLDSPDNPWTCLTLLVDRTSSINEWDPGTFHVLVPSHDEGLPVGSGDLVGTYPISRKGSNPESGGPGMLHLKSEREVHEAKMYVTVVNMSRPLLIITYRQMSTSTEIIRFQVQTALRPILPQARITPGLPLYLESRDQIKSLEFVIFRIRRGQRLRLALLLAQTVLELGSEFLGADWGKEDVFFLLDALDETSIEQPFLLYSGLGSRAHRPNPTMHQSNDVQHGTIYSLGIILLELSLGMTLESSYDQKDLGADGQASDWTKLLAIAQFQKRVEEQADDRWAAAARWCLHDSAALRNVDKSLLFAELHSNVVLPLHRKVQVAEPSIILDHAQSLLAGVHLARDSQDNMLCRYCEVFSNLLASALDTAVADQQSRPDSLDFAHHPSFLSLGMAADDGCRVCGLLRGEFLRCMTDDNVLSEETMVAELKSKDKETPLAFRVTVGRRLMDTAILSVPSGVQDLSFRADWPNMTARLTLSSSQMGESEGEHVFWRHLEGVPDIDLCRKWLQSCDSLHRLCVQSYNQAHPTRLLDIGDPHSRDQSIFLVEPTKLEAANDRMQYVALSHYWSSKSGMASHTTKSNYARQMNGVSMATLPRTVKDAINLSRLLRVRYLWVDSLCIIQDDMDDRFREINRISAIYRNAYLTIAASDSESPATGILGARTLDLEGSVKLRLRNSSGASVGAAVLSACVRDPSRKSINHTVSHHEPRAWALQEIMLSRRVLYFRNHTISWACATSQCEPTSLYPLTASRKTLLRSLEHAMPRPSALVRQWYPILEEYTQMHLTFASDTLAAISGLASEFQLSTGFTYCEGLWQEDLGAGLAWYRASNGHTRVKSTLAKVPSWSWASVQSPVRYWSFESPEHGPLSPWLNFVGFRRETSDLHARSILTLDGMVRGGYITHHPGSKSKFLLSSQPHEHTPLAEFIPDKVRYGGELADSGAMVMCLFLWQRPLSGDWAAVALSRKDDNCLVRMKRLGLIIAPRQSHSVGDDHFSIPSFFSNCERQRVALV